MTPTADSVAQWMAERVLKEGILSQQQAAYEIIGQFGEEFTYLNEKGNLAIRRDVLRQFRSMTEDSVVWNRGQRMWRTREAYDDPGRRTTDW